MSSPPNLQILVDIYTIKKQINGRGTKLHMKIMIKKASNTIWANNRYIFLYQCFFLTPNFLQKLLNLNTNFFTCVHISYFLPIFSLINVELISGVLGR